MKIYDRTFQTQEHPDHPQSDGGRIGILHHLPILYVAWSVDRGIARIRACYYDSDCHPLTFDVGMDCEYLMGVGLEMGKIKGWSKEIDVDDYSMWKHKSPSSNRGDVIIEIRRVVSTASPKPQKIWAVNKIVNGGGVVGYGYYLTKNDATDVAVDYMRSHPNG